MGRFRLNISSEKRDNNSDAHKLRLANSLDELDARALEEFLISGCAIQRIVYERRFNGTGVWIDNVNPSHFFSNRFTAPRGSDIRIIGMLHDVSRPELLLRFGHESKRRCRQLDDLFTQLKGFSPNRPLISIADDAALPSFYTPADPELCRIIEVWQFEVDRHKEPVWRCRYYAADGSLIDQTRSPYPHRSHPFSVTFYPLTDGEVHPYIEDVIDQQQHINLLVATVNHLLSNSAKGLLMIPTDSLACGMSFEDVARVWSQPGGVLPINPNASRLPSEVISSASSDGASRLLDLELKLFQQISGVSSALQGQAQAGTTSASLYESQVYNSAVSLLDIFETFNSFRNATMAKALSLLNMKKH
ncbi:MAG: hypothetical protein J1E29_00775 [Duncaniella sp.]|nr:hypothetical protein [Duncaniella sp.]